jgi:hypothetical protein
MASSPLRRLVYGVRLWSLIATGAVNIATIAEKAMGYAMLFPVAPTALERAARKRKAFQPLISFLTRRLFDEINGLANRRGPESLYLLE